MTSETARSISEVVANDLCIGCRLCEALTGGKVAMVMTPVGSLRPSPTDAFTPHEETQLMASCPGAVAQARAEDGIAVDPVWGAHRWMSYAWAGQPDTRHRAATGGVLTALGAHALNTGRANFVLHVGADPERSMRSRWVLSPDPDSIRANTSSRYGPTAPLTGLAAALERRRSLRQVLPGHVGRRVRLGRRDPLQAVPRRSGRSRRCRRGRCLAGGSPTGEDEGFNGIVVRTAVGEELVASAVASGDLVLGDPITPRQFDGLQPHQVCKKEALAARYQGLRDAGVAPIETHDLRISELGSRMDAGRFAQQRSGAQRRIEAARSRQLTD